MSSEESMSNFGIVPHGLAITEMIVLLIILYKIQNFDLKNKRLMKDLEEIENRILSIQDWFMILFVVSIMHSVSILSLKMDSKTNALIIGAALPVLLSVGGFMYSSNLQSLSETVNSNLILFVIIQMVILVGLHSIFYVIILPMINRMGSHFDDHAENQNEQLPDLPGEPGFFAGIKQVPSEFGERVTRYTGSTKGQTMSEMLTEWMGGKPVPKQHISPGLSKEFMQITQSEFDRISWEQKLNELFQGNVFDEFRILCEKTKQLVVDFVPLENTSRDKIFDTKAMFRKSILLGQSLDKILQILIQWIVERKVSNVFATFAVQIVVQMMGDVILQEIEKISTFYGNDSAPSEILVNYIKSSPNVLQNQIQSMAIDDNVWVVAISRIYTLFSLISIVCGENKTEFTQKSLIDFELEMQKYLREKFFDENQIRMKPNVTLFMDEKSAQSLEQKAEMQRRNEDIMDQIYYLFEKGFVTGMSYSFSKTKRSLINLPSTIFGGAAQAVANWFKPNIQDSD